jgi:integrase
MSRRTKGPRLWLRPARYNEAGQLTHESAWFIIDGNRQRSTGFGANDIAQAEKALADYLAEKHVERVEQGTRDPSSILIADVLTLYVRDKVPDHARPDDTAYRIAYLQAFWGGRKLSEVTGATCREYARQSSTPAAARRQLEELRSAINHHRREGLHDKIVSVVLPPRSLPRERWLTREEAARFVIKAWRYKDRVNFRRVRKHIARFALVALYTGSRAGVVCSAAFQREEGRAWVDVEHGVLHRRAEGERETKKRRPAVRLPDQLVAHLRRWKACGQRYVVEWNGQPVSTMDWGFRAAVKDAGLGNDVTPHTLRHTAATWLMQNGADLWGAAGYLGMTVQTLERVYGHHHPDHQASVRGAFRRDRNRQ